MVEQGLTRNTEFAGRGTSISVVALECSTKELPPEILLRFIPGSCRADLGLDDRQMLPLHHATSGPNQRHLDGLAEFTHVAWPPVPPHHCLGVATPGAGRNAMTGHGLAFEEALEQTYVLSPFTQRWNRQRWGRDSVVEILAEGPLPHSQIEIRVGRRQDTNIDDSRLRNAFKVDNP